jgi:hypothetical protein
MLRRVHLVLALALLGAPLAGCKKPLSLEEVTARYRAPLEQHLQALSRIAEQASRLPPLERDAVTIAGNVIVERRSIRNRTATASLAYAEDLADPNELGYVWGRLPNVGVLNHCASLLHRGHLAYDPSQPLEPLLRADEPLANEWYPACLASRYLFVIRTLEFVKPSAAAAFTATLPVNSVDAGSIDAGSRDAGAIDGRVPAGPPSARLRGVKPGVDAGAGDAGPASDAGPSLAEQMASDGAQHHYTFDAGLVRAELLVFELPSAKYLGGFRFTARSSPKVQGTNVEADLQRQVGAALNEGLRRAFPGITLWEQD